MTGIGSAASTMRRAAVAQPEPGGQDAEDGRLVQPERGVAGIDPHHHLLRGELIAVVERLDDRTGVAVGLGEDLAQVGKRLLGAAEDPLAAREDLHRHHRVELLGGEDRPRALEVHVGGLAGEHVGGGRKCGDGRLGRHGRSVRRAPAGRG